MNKICLTFLLGFVCIVKSYDKSPVTVLDDDMTPTVKTELNSVDVKSYDKSPVTVLDDDMTPTVKTELNSVDVKSYDKSPVTVLDDDVTPTVKTELNSVDVKSYDKSPVTVLDDDVTPTVKTELNSVDEYELDRKCLHKNFTFGKSHRKQELGLSRQVLKNSKLLFGVTVDVRYPEKGKLKKRCSITEAIIINLRTKCNCFKEKASIVEGGIGTNFIKVRVESERNCGNRHDFKIYQRCRY